MVLGWGNASDDTIVREMGQRVVLRVQELSRRLGLYEPFLCVLTVLPSSGAHC